MNEMRLDNNHNVYLDGDKIARFSNNSKNEIAQLVECMLKTEEGEAFTNIEHGIPWLEKILGLPMSHLDVATKIIKEKILQVEGVESIISLELVAGDKEQQRNITGSFKIKCTDGSIAKGGF